MARGAVVTDHGPAIAIEGLRHVYPDGDVVALDGVSLVVERGSVAALVGQNGSGKTTLAKHLNGLLRPTAGRVVVDGLDTSQHRVQELARHVGFAFQNPNHQLFARTVADELAYGPRNLGVPPAEVEARVASAAATVGLASLTTHPYRLPFPIRKLVTIAAVLAMRPTILVLDEPTTGLDHRTSRRVLDLIRGVRDEGTTVVCVSHDMGLVAGIADRIVVLDAGRIAADGEPRGVLSDRTMLAAIGLRPPQITELSLALPARAGRVAALTVAELVADHTP
jgi:energy-coupling factor transporter ATP-binding protein EcfA2